MQIRRQIRVCLRICILFFYFAFIFLFFRRYQYNGKLTLRKMAYDVRAEYDKLMSAHNFLPEIFGGPKDRFGVIRTLFVEWDNLEWQLRTAILRRSEVSELLVEEGKRLSEKDTALLQREKLQLMQDVTWFLQRRDAIKQSLIQFLTTIVNELKKLGTFEVNFIPNVIFAHTIQISFFNLFNRTKK